MQRHHQFCAPVKFKSSLPLVVTFGLVLAVLVSVGRMTFVSADEAHDSKIYTTGFEPATFKAGSALVGVDGWTTLFFLNPDAAMITDTEKKSGRQSVEVWGGDLESSALFTFPPYDAVGSYRNPVNFTVSADKPIVVVEADLLLETDAPVTDDDFFGLTIAARSGDGETLGEMGLTSSGRAVAYSFNALPDADPTFTAPIEFNRWHRARIEIDYSSETTSYFLDGKFIGVISMDSASNVLLRASMVVYALPDGGGDTRDDYTARFDNFRVSIHGADDEQD